ncbi:MAG: hypothetical protein RLZ04_1632 [Actinomycetota bacterium]
MPAHTSTAEILLRGSDPLGPTIGFFTALGFRVRTILPADHPTMVRLEGHGLRLVLDSTADHPAGHVVLRSDTEEPRTLTAPNGTLVTIEAATPRVDIPEIRQEFVLTRAETGDAFGEGRAGMQYRDLIPSRLGGAYIASNILIPTGGDVPDYVHYHNVRFQMIYCHRGWVKVLYEDQGEMLTMRPGDCVLQPPTIRHRVCEASDGMEVVEIGCPAIHETWADPDTELPTGRSLPDRGYGEIGHRFVFHVAEESAWTPWTQGGWECRDTGITAATDGMADVHTVRPIDTGSRADMTHDGEFSFVFVRDGEVTLERDGADPTVLRSGDSINIPPGMRVALSSPTADLTLLHVGLP